MSVGVLFLCQNRGYNTAVRGQMAEVLPTVCPCSAGLLAGICWKKSQKSLLFPMGEGEPWLQMTGALYIPRCRCFDRKRSFTFPLNIYSCDL